MQNYKKSMEVQKKIRLFCLFFYRNDLLSMVVFANKCYPQNVRMKGKM